MKTCKRCGEEKPLGGFGNDARGRDGKVAICKTCDSRRGCEWAKRNPEKSRQRSLNWSRNNAEKHREHTRKYLKKNPDCLKNWRAKNPEASRATNRRNNYKKLHSVDWRLRNRISCAMRRSLKDGKGRRGWESLVGYTLADLKRHIEKQFVDGMSWERFPEIHIDHIIPLSAFNFCSVCDIDFGLAWSLKNLRPMWAKDNMSKGDRLGVPFQPSLLISVGGQ